MFIKWLAGVIGIIISPEMNREEFKFAEFEAENTEFKAEENTEFDAEENTEFEA